MDPQQTLFAMINPVIISEEGEHSEEAGKRKEKTLFGF
jgi:predicted metalloprotease